MIQSQPALTGSVRRRFSKVAGVDLSTMSSRQSLAFTSRLDMWLARATPDFNTTLFDFSLNMLPIPTSDIAPCNQHAQNFVVSRLTASQAQLMQFLDAKGIQVQTRTSPPLRRTAGSVPDEQVSELGAAHADAGHPPPVQLADGYILCLWPAEPVQLCMMWDVMRCECILLPHRCVECTAGRLIHAEQMFTSGRVQGAVQQCRLPGLQLCHEGHAQHWRVRRDGHIHAITAPADFDNRAATMLRCTGRCMARSIVAGLAAFEELRS